MRRLKLFDYFEPHSLPEAIQMLAEKGDGAYPLAGVLCRCGSYKKIIEAVKIAEQAMRTER